MIGNVEILTSFDRNLKPSYILKIPLQFWFCTHSGLSIPLVALQYHDVTIDVTFRKIEQVSYIELNQTIYLPNGNSIFLQQVPAELGIDITATLLIDYIFIDQSERRRFATSSHEYLIEQIQILEFSNITQQDNLLFLKNFVHPSKELIWVAQQEAYVTTANGYIQQRYDNYSLTIENTGNIINESKLEFNGYDRISRRNCNYFNYVQPYEVHNKTPSDGINNYSFAIFPEETQPSGTANFSTLTDIKLFLYVDSSLLLPDGTIQPITIRIYTRNHNILRFINGFAGTAYTYG